MAAYVEPRLRRARQLGTLLFIFLFIMIGYKIISSVVSLRSLPMDRIHQVKKARHVELTHHRYDFVINNPGICGGNTRLRTRHRDDGQEGAAWLFVAIVSKPSHVRARSLIRKTYATAKQHRGRGILYGFFVGSTADHEIQQRLYNESGEFSDILQEEFADGAPGSDTSRKTMMAVKWAWRHCAGSHYILKITDEVMVNPYHLVDSLIDDFKLPPLLERPVGAVSDSSRVPHWLLCDVKSKGQEPDRADGLVVEEIPGAEYPEHCGGAGGLFITDTHTLKALYDAYINTTYLWHSGVHITGVLPKVSKQPIHLLPFPKKLGVSHSAENKPVDVGTRSFFFRKGLHDFFPGPGVNGDALWKMIREERRDDANDLL